MTLLDRFRTQPQKHPDPAVRLAHVGEIPLTERELIAAIAREDEDARVRKAAVAKLMDPAALGAIAKYGAAAATPVLRTAFADKDWAVRVRAVMLLKQLDPAAGANAPPAAAKLARVWCTSAAPAKSRPRQMLCATMTLGADAIARATARRWRFPPESAAARVSGPGARI